jgi:hypothetical protein
VGDYAAELGAIHAESGSRGVIAFLPGFGWTTGLIQRPHHLARELARLGYLVLFMDYVERGAPTGFLRIEDRLYVAVLPSGVQRAVYETLPHISVLTATYQYPNVATLRDPLIIYDVLDHLDVFTSLHPLSHLRRWHADLLERAGVVLCTSDVLLDATRAVRSDAILCPNAVDAAHFAQTPPPPDAMRPILAMGKPIIGYYGTLAHWVDYALIRQSAAAYPDWSFVVIGPDADGSFAASALHERHNVHWIDAVPYADLPAYLAYFDVATIPFVVNDLTAAVSPVKLFEYMAGGRPIVSSALPECRKYPVVAVAESADEYNHLLARALMLRRDPAHTAGLAATAGANTWAARAAQIAQALDQRIVASGRTANVHRSGA